MELYTNTLKRCSEYGCKFLHTINTECKIQSRCGHISIVSPTNFLKKLIGVYCENCMNEIKNRERALCIKCNNEFITNDKNFLICSLCAEITKKRTRIEFAEGNTNQKNNYIKYETIKSTYESKGCVLITTREQYIQMRINCPLRSVVFDIVSKCGHGEKSLYYTFVNANTGVYCKNCTTIRKNQIMRDQAFDNEGHGQSLSTQHIAIQFIKMMCVNVFEVKKTRDGCDSDLLIRPIGTSDDLWLKIRIKSTIFGEGEVRFRIHKVHLSVHIFMSIVTKEMWLFDPETIDLKTYYMKHQPNKYDTHRIANSNDLNEKLLVRYTLAKYAMNFVDANMPISPQMQLEYRYVLKREETLKFLNFEKNLVTGSVYNFKINNLKFQEIVTSHHTKRKSIIATLAKGAGNNTRRPYELGDNDFYWININDCSDDFYVIPERSLYVNGIIASPEDKGSVSLNLSTNLWTESYKYNYQTINLYEERNRLIGLLEL